MNKKSKNLRAFPPHALRRGLPRSQKIVKSYVDGNVEADAAFSDKPDTSPGPLTIGMCTGFPYPVKGIMDDVGLFNVALTKDDIQNIMTKGLADATGIAAVSSVDKLATVWGKIKAGL